MTALSRLYLFGTQVSDISALSGLTALSSLVLSGTQVSDISALSGLTALSSLDLRGTQVSDILALSGFVWLCLALLLRAPMPQHQRNRPLPVTFFAVPCIAHSSEATAGAYRFVDSRVCEKGFECLHIAVEGGGK